MQHRIVVLGAGYAGACAAGYLARRLHPSEVEITVVNAEAEFVERMRLHQLAAGDDGRRHQLADLFAGTGIRLRVARVTALDVHRREVTVTDGAGTDLIGYDTLLHALGSTAADRGVPGVSEHAFDVAGRPSALRLRRRLDELGGEGTVLVVGGGLTAIEAATEIAESRPGLRVVLATSGRPGGWFGPKARRHLLRAFDRFGIEVHAHTTVVGVDASGVRTADGTVLRCDATVWAAGFSVPSLAADAGLAVDDDGRMLVDRQMRSVSHPQVYAAGDGARAVGDNGRPLPMSCATAGLTRMQATASIIGDLTGRRIPVSPLAYTGNCVSLGRADALFQVVDREGRSTWSLRGAAAAWMKAGVLRATAWNQGHPTYGLPARRLRLPGAIDRPVEAVRP
ncbi:NAD(P)/FAD-dependent oxidoreductase [Pseudonocardia broussonetiae]|uniref:FAD-dependent oxidoreductase n=1 Tax=Pseudonocardia broussonetiae TaxID=2736640 RepID=A0A6M6JM43_9PSEU|nr:FAD-dependent oxidoreductase [Pseudonocardia broussonetiae]QJY47712.1 FAD-dependent oxidoreductase [Pseudonocardia broussonetiae]